MKNRNFWGDPPTRGRRSTHQMMNFGLAMSLKSLELYAMSMLIIGNLSPG